MYALRKFTVNSKVHCNMLTRTFLCQQRSIVLFSDVCFTHQLHQNALCSSLGSTFLFSACFKIWCSRVVLSLVNVIKTKKRCSLSNQSLDNLLTITSAQTPLKDFYPDNGNWFALEREGTVQPGNKLMYLHVWVQAKLHTNMQIYLTHEEPRKQHKQYLRYTCLNMRAEIQYLACLNFNDMCMVNDYHVLCIIGGDHIIKIKTTSNIAMDPSILKHPEGQPAILYVI